MLSANVIEYGSFYLTNLVKNGKSVSSSERVYGTQFNYSQWLIPEHTYYYSFKYSYSDPANASQAPNKVAFYYADGMGIAGSWETVNGTAETEHKGLFTPTTMWSYPNQGSWGYGSVYHKYEQGTTVVTKKVAKMTVKDVVVTDVTFLYKLLKGQGLTDARCITKLNEFSTPDWFYLYGVKEVVLFPLGEWIQKVCFKKSYAHAYEFIECDGMTAYSVGYQGKDCYFDQSDKLSIYDNASSGTVTKKRVIDTSSPFYPKHQYVLQVKTAVTSTTPSPGLGGIVNYFVPNNGDLIVEKIVAKIPIGYHIECHNNSVAGGEIAPTSYQGTGNYEEYTFTYKIGSSGTPESIGHLAVHANSTGCPDTKNVTWYIAYINYCKLTDTGITDWCAMPGSVKVKDERVYTSEIDSQNLFLNGDGSDTNVPLPDKYQWISGDQGYDIEGWNAIIQPSTTSTASSQQIVGPKMPINPLSRYKLSCRIWADGSKIDKFLMALPYYINESDDSKLSAYKVWYTPGTNTTLAEDAAAGATKLTLTDASKWTSGGSYRGIGIRSSVYKSYHDVWTSTPKTGLVTNVTGNVITLHTGLPKAYAKNTRICEAEDGSEFYYPISKNMLPIKQWKTFEIYFGKPDEMWDGRGVSWVDIPWDAKYMGFIPNLYSNNSGSPIIFDNIRIEEVYTPAEKKDQKVQIKKFGVRKGNFYSANTTLYSVKLASNLKSGFTVKVNNNTLTKTTDVAKFRAESIINLSCTGSYKVTENGTPYTYTFDKFNSSDIEKYNGQLTFTSVKYEFFYYEPLIELSAGTYTFTPSNFSESQGATEPFNGFCAIAYDISQNSFSPDADIHHAYTSGNIVDVFDLYYMGPKATTHTFNKSVRIVVYNCVYDYLVSWYKTTETDPNSKYITDNVDYSLDLKITQTAGVTITNNQFTMPEHDVVLDVAYKKTQVPKYTFTVIPPAKQNNNKVTVYFNKIVINGSEYQCSTTRTFQIYAGNIVTLGYKSSAYAYNSEQFINTFQSWTPTGFTISNNQFTMPAKDCSLTWEYTYTQLYKVSIETSTNCSPKVGLTEGNCNEQELWVASGTTVWWNINADDSYTDFYVTIEGESTTILHTGGGHFTMPASNVTITAEAKKIEYYTIKLANPIPSGSYTIKANNKNLDTTGFKVAAGTMVTLVFTGGYIEVDTGHRFYFSLSKYSSSQVTIDNNVFYMPNTDVTISVSTSKTDKYEVSIGTVSGGTMKVGTISSLNSAAYWAFSGELIYWKFDFNSGYNECNLKIVQTSDTTVEYKSYDSYGSDNGSFTMPSYAVTISGNAYSNLVICPFEGLMVYSILNSSGSRAMYAGNNASKSPVQFNGYQKELEDTISDSMDLPTTDYLSQYGNYQQMPEAIKMGSTNIQIYCAFAVDRTSSGKVVINSCSNFDGKYVYVQRGMTVTLDYDSTTTSLTSNSTIKVNFTQIQMAENIDVYLGWIELLLSEEWAATNGLCQRLHIDINGAPYSIDFSYEAPEPNAPIFYPGYTPRAIQNNYYAVPILQAPLYDAVQATSWDGAINLIYPDTSTNVIIVPLWNNFSSDSLISIGVGYDFLDPDMRANNNPTILYSTPFDTFSSHSQTYDCLAIVDNNKLQIDLEKAVGSGLIKNSEDVEDILTGTMDKGLFISVGRSGTLYTFITSEGTQNYNERNWIQQSAKSNSWGDTSIEIYDEETNDYLTAGALLINND